MRGVAMLCVFGLAAAIVNPAIAASGTKDRGALRDQCRAEIGHTARGGNKTTAVRACIERKMNGG